MVVGGVGRVVMFFGDRVMLVDAVFVLESKRKLEIVMFDVVRDGGGFENGEEISVVWFEIE